MARIRTVDFLPEIFQTTTNKQFLAATLDQLVQEPQFKKIQGFVGRQIGPGVNPNDKYVAESSAERANYQLEPGVILKGETNGSVADAITYPGITDALALQGANVQKQDRLYTSDYYTWDPFVDFDKFVNFSQYYWLPAGPDSVDVFSEGVPTTDNFTVTRSNGVYTFSGVAGENPVLTLVRGGNYTFDVAQNDKETVNFRVTNNGTSAYVIDYADNPTLTLVRGNTYTFTLVLNGAYPFYIKELATLGTNNLYSSGVTNNGAATGTVTFTVPQDAPNTLYYVNSTQPNMRGVLNIINGTPGTGPGFWIQTDPGVSGRIPSTPNISSRDVLGVINNGEDLGTVTFNVPLSTAQDFYYNMPSIGTVDLVTNLQFDQINNRLVSEIISNYGGIDGTLDLNGRTLIFTNTVDDAQDGGWQITSQYDPLLPGPANNGLIGSYDTTLFDQTLDIVDKNVRYSIWQINYFQDTDGNNYVRLTSISPVSELTKFNILYGTVYSNTSWYKDAEGYFEQIPLLTAVKDTLYYQDGTDPEIFGRIRVIDQSASAELDINEIIGKKNYTSPNGVVFTNGLKVQFIGQVNPISYQNQEYYVEGVGTAIQLLPVGNYVTPETYTQSATVPYDSTPYDVGNYDASLNQPLVPDYLTINRASPDLNPWTRSNRWFHIDVINASAAYNNTQAVLDNNFRGKRPILEFRAGTKLFDFGTQGKQPVDIIDFAATDALSTINGTIGYSIDGYSFINGTRVIFANDSDPQVRNKIYTVEFIVPDTVAPLITQPIINLVPASDATVLINQTVVCLSGILQQGQSFYFDGVEWISAQQKTKTNQAPLFDIYDSAGVSFSNRDKYPSTNFSGTKLFSYATGTGTQDTVLGFALKYLSLANVGDIVFANDLYTDTFVYTKDNVSSTEFISQGFVRQYRNRTEFSRELGWQSAVTKSLIRQQFKFVYDGQPLQLDIKVDQTLPVPAVQVFVGADFQDPGSYTIQTTANTTLITLDNTYVIGDVVDVAALSDQASQVGFYQVPINLENNPLNENSTQFTLGTIRSHYETIGQNLINLQGPINGANNTRDLGNIIPYGLNILQQSSPMTMAGYFMRSKEYNIFAALEYNSREYEKFKAQLLETAVRNDYSNLTVPQILTAAISDITAGRTENYPFYWSDMLPAGTVYTQNTYTHTPISTSVFDLSRTYDFTSSNYFGLLVYLNDRLLTIGYDYTVATDGPRLTITVPLAVGDVIVIQQYENTYGSFVPNTPTKLGLYPAFKPEIYLDQSYVNPTLVIRGHDGSITVAFDDFRDQLLLEFEKRIYNNLKIKSEIPLTVADVIPGQFRTTDYTLAEINTILAPDFLSWVGWNKLNYLEQNYIANNEFTWNYRASGNKLTGITNPLAEAPLPAGAWRGIYSYFYDTVAPDTRPWEMLGFSEQPDWWTDVYGPAPYTQNNLVLWDDLAAGKVADPAGEYFRPQYARPGLVNVIPTGSEGQLLSPFDSVVGLYDSSQFQKSWVFSDVGPVEYTWKTSSSYPFAVMRLLALTRPAEFFSLFADRDLYKFSSEFGQYLYNGRYRLDANGIEIYGSGTSKASFIDWIVDYNQQSGRSSSANLSDDLKNLDVRLCYRMGSFTDKQYLKIYTEKSSPNSLNSSLLLPDESYNLLVYKNQPFDRVSYSSVILQVVQGGYAVFGYSILTPYFQILASRTSGRRQTISSGGSTVTVPTQYTQDVVQVPYGYVFTNQTVVADFLLSYGALLESQGLSFTTTENGKILNWNQMVQEFLYWANQGWEIGSVINLNPTAFSLTASKENAIVDSIVAETPEYLLLDQNRTTLPVRDLVVDRIDNTFTATSLSNQTISYIDIRYTSYENMVVLDNVSIFNDLIYDPVTGARQSRINVVATVSSDWNGQLDAQGFILNDDRTVRQWQPELKYAKGEIVLYKNNYWSAQTIVQPKAEFDYADWVKSDYTKIQRGLLQNIPNKADQLANSYNVSDANLETDQDLLSYGLIGFRPREYMTALNLSDVSQVNLYQQFLKSKGTDTSIRLIGNANLGKEIAEYDVFENWAVLRATYGANANRSFIELRLNEALLDSNPSTVQVIDPQQQSIANQSILLEDVWRESYKLTSTDILPTTLITPTDSALPSAGYVNINDVDVTVFSLEGNLALAPGVLDDIGVGTTIWAAKSNSYDWNVYRCEKTPGLVKAVSTNLNSTSTVTFDQQHGLALADIVIIKEFNSSVNGVYRVLSVPSLNSIVIELTIPTELTGNGLCYSLESMRVAQASDIANLPYASELTTGTKVWVDNNGNNRWTVLEKRQPFSSGVELTVEEPEVGAKFGSSIAQSQDNIIAMIGAPGASGAAGFTTGGAIYTYFKDLTNRYTPGDILELNAVGTSGYGNAIEIGNVNWAVAGASQSNNNQGYAMVTYRLTNSNAVEQRQLLVAPDLDFGAGEFGHAVTISNDERWLYVSAPVHNKVYAYGRFDVETQATIFITDGIGKIYNFDGLIVIDNDLQLNLVLDNKLLVYGTDYSVVDTLIVLTTVPAEGQRLIVSRKIEQQLDQQTYYGVTQNATSGGGSGATFTVNRTRGVYTTSLTAPGIGYNIGDTVTIYGTTIGGGTTPANDLVITVTAETAGGITGFTTSGSGVNNTATFPIGQYLYTATNIFAFSVTVNGVFQRPEIDYDFNTANEIVFNTIPAAGADIRVTAKDYFTYVNTITVPGLSNNARLGYSLATTTDGRQVIIGAINDDDSGSVYVYDRSVTRYIVSDATETSYALPAGFAGPVSVLLNNEFLLNSDQFINGQFSVVGSDVVLNSTVTLNVGDIIELESNIFTQVQKITADVPFETAQYGYAVDVCPNNCSVYIGAPQDGTVIQGAGSVERRVNQNRVYGVITSTVANPALTAGNTIRINNMPVAVPANPNNTVTGLRDAINSAAIPNVVASVANGLLTISVANVQAADEFSRLIVLPGTSGTAFADLGLEPYAYTQTIVSPLPSFDANFGAALFVDSEADNLVVGAPNANSYTPVTFDNGTTYFDDKSTTFTSVVEQSGVVYTYDYLSSSTDSVTNPGKLAFGQQIFSPDIMSLDQWGTAVNYTTGVLLVGAPGNDLGDSTLSDLNYGQVVAFTNADKTPAWVPIHIQQPVVDVYLLNSVYMFDRLQSSKTYFLDFFNPLQGKILGAARQNIDFISAIDPAKYNAGTVNNNGNYWGEEHVGQIWWDTDSVRFIDPNQDDIDYASRRWGQVFPGSTVDVYQWVSSDVPPAQYAGAGTPFSTTSFTVNTRLTVQGTFATDYYFWVRGIDTIQTTAGKTLSTIGIARYIEDPRSSGIPYLAALNSSTVAIYNSREYISAADTILHIEYDRELNSDNIHTEYELIARNNPDSFLSAGLYRKLQDSFCGVNTVGALVPDPTLSPPERYGVQFRPRQSMFVDRFAALENYLSRANTVLKKFPISETRRFVLLNSSEPEPTAASGEWNLRLANIEQLGYQDLNEVPLGYKYLIVSDSTNDGLWSIYTVAQGSALLGSPRITQLYRVQTYDTRKYWSYIDWYQIGYNSSIQPVAEVPNYSALATLSVAVGSSVRVTANAQNKWEIYLKTDTGWERVGLQDGTIEFSAVLWNYALGRFGFDVEVFDAQYFDQEPVIETRKIIQAINEELFVDELLIERNNLLMLMFDYVLSESTAPEWLVKTSLIDVNHKIRELVPYQIYRQDNQDFVLQYIQEVKPYHVQIREFNLTYNGADDYLGTLTDFDLPAYYDTALIVPQYVSPVLLPYTQSTGIGTGTTNTNSDTAPTAEIWDQQPWTEWFNNYTLSIQDVDVINSGSGYTIPPEVIVTGTATTPAELIANINSAGKVISITVIEPGSGYVTTPVITIVGGNGSGALAYPVMNNQLVRSFTTTIKYDRYQYNSTIVDWQPNVSYDNGTQVRYLDQVWQADNTDSTAVESSTFDPDQWTLVSAGSLSGVDRTQGFYAPSVNEPGLDLPLLIDGLDYPGVQVMGPGFNQNSGYDVGNYDINPYDNIAYGPEGKPTYDPAILDAIYESPYLDPFLGTRPTDINVDGGAYVDTYSSHAPEELVPGAEFDTLDMRVYTRPGSDWEFNGHGFATYSLSVAVETLPQNIDFSVWFDFVPYLVTGTLTNETTGVDLLEGVNYTVDWETKVFTVTSGCNIGNTLIGTAYGLGGGNQLFKQKYNGADVGNTVTVPVAFNEIQEFAVFVNGHPVTNYTYSQSGSSTQIVFSTTYTSADYIVVVAIGPTLSPDGSTEIAYSWSTPVTQYIVGDGSSLSFELDNSLEYTNPANMIVTVNGVRARTAAGAEYIADGSSAYQIPERLGFSQQFISDNEVLVYIDDIPQVLGVAYTVDPWTGDQRNVVFTVEPEIGSRILIAVTTRTQCFVNGNQLLFDPTQGLVPLLGDTITVTTWNDTRQQNILTQVFVGPTTRGVVVEEGYDMTDYDAATLSNTPGSFDYAAGVIVTVNDLQLGRIVTDPSRLWVTLNGFRLFYGEDFTVNGEELVLTAGIISPTDTVMITDFTNSIVPEAMAFRIFQDMRGVQATYRITANTTTALSQTLYPADDTIYVENASALPLPDVAANIWGVITINGERIMYRELDVSTNTITSLLRGTAGTAVAEHTQGSVVYDLGRGNLMPAEFQNYIDSNSTLADGSETTFTAPDVVFEVGQTALANGAVEVYVGGTRVLSGYTITNIDPVTVEFDTAPANGSQVTILVRRGVTWYAPGIDTASNGVALQDTNTQAARFLRGL